MDEFKTDKAVYSAEDFQLWDASKILEVSPKFQRRPVWSTPIRSFFIDTLLRQMTVPPIYLRITQDSLKTKQIREVVDGQQRIRCVLDFLNDKFRLSKTLPASWAGKHFSGLSSEEKHKIKQFGFSTEIFKGLSDQQVLEVFCRLNMYGVPLNKQELRNGKYFGLFKQTSYRLAYDHLEFWRLHKLFSERSIARMLEVELTSELLIAGDAGMQDKKGSIDNYYLEWEDSYPEQKRDERRFRETLGVISETFQGDSLAQSEFRRPPMFYTLYCAVYHYLHGMPDVLIRSPRKPLTSDNRDSLRDATLHLSEIISQYKDSPNESPKKFQAFILASSRQTDNIKPRMTRFNTLFETAFR